MHVEKNISESTFRTLLGIEGKNKDTDKTRKDLKNMNIRSVLHFQECPDGSFDKPHAFFSLYPEERDGFYEFLKSVKYPDGYVGNISRSLNTRNGRLLNLKSHDCHVLLQQFFQLGCRVLLIRTFVQYCLSWVVSFKTYALGPYGRGTLQKLEGRILLILCKLKKYFPPAFFDVMVNLAVHLPQEAILGGPVQYRWMYPIER